MAAVETYVYGVQRAGGEVAPPVQGVGDPGAPVRVVTSGQLSALVSDVPAGELLASREDVYRHSEILQTLMRAGTILPMQFGTIMPDEKTVGSELLGAFRAQLEELLKKVHGHVELNLRATYSESVLREVINENSAIAALNERVRGRSPSAAYYESIRLGEMVAAQIEAKRAADAPAILDRLEPLAAEVRLKQLGHERTVLNAAFLVDEREVARFDEAAEAVAVEQANRMRFRYIGPVPPYSFVELNRD